MNDQQFHTILDQITDMGNGIKKEVGVLGQRIDRLENRFDRLEAKVDNLETRMDQRFEEVDRRFEKLETKMDQKFDEVNANVGRVYDSLQAVLEDQDAAKKQQQALTDHVDRHEHWIQQASPKLRIRYDRAA